MAIPILFTKVHVPQPRLKSVNRPSLIERLNSGVSKKLTLISAPAGFGKTTLVTEWLQGTVGEKLQDNHVAWFSLDEGDNDPVQFLTYFIEALIQSEAIDSITGQAMQNMLESPQMAETEAFLIPLINELSRSKYPIFLILDDYHRIQKQGIDRILSFLITHLPSTSHVIITTREDPNLPLARLRGRDQLSEIRARDLRFSSKEVGEFLNQVMGLSLSSDEIDLLDTRTEGWIAGLQLAAISMRNLPDTKAFIRSFTGSNRYILDYLIEEVLQQQPERVQEFMLQTSILERFSASLCNAVTGQDDGQEVLEELENANLFIVPLDNERRWYRYHHLFADLLRQRQNQTEAENIPTLHRSASKWFSKEGENREAIKHSLAAKDYERAIELIEAIGIDVLQQGNHTSVSGWISKIPEEIIIQHPYLCVLHAWVLQQIGEIEKSETRLAFVDQIVGTKLEHKDFNGDKLLALLNYRQAYSSFLKGEHEETISYAEKALDLLPESANLIRVHTVLFLGLANRNLGQFQEALDIYHSILHVTENLGGTSVAVFHYIHLSDLYWEMAQVERAKEFCEKALSITEQKTGRPDMPYCGFVYTRLGRILREWNQLQDSFEFTMKGHALCLDWQVVELLALSYIEVAYINLALGNTEKAFTSIDEAIRINEEFSEWGRQFAEAHKAIIKLSKGDIEFAEKIVQTNDPFFDENYQFQREIEYLMYSRLLIAKEKFDDARILINQIYEHAQEVGKKLTELKCLILFSKLYYQEGNVDQALDYLSQALEIAEPEGFIRIFIDEGPPMARLLYAALEKEIAPDYVRKLLSSFPIQQEEHAGAEREGKHIPELFEQLSEREIEVLRLISEGLSRQEIAEELVLSLNTIKTHARNIYRKLDVNSQIQAVGKARGLGLLGQD